MSSINWDKIVNLIEVIDSFPPLPVGIVLTPRAYNDLQRAGEPMQYNFHFMDLHQTKECLVFYDLVLLKSYLQRREHPEAFLDAQQRYQAGEPLSLRLEAWASLT